LVFVLNVSVGMDIEVLLLLLLVVWVGLPGLGE
jgi:hypothetical protein